MNDMIFPGDLIDHQGKFIKIKRTNSGVDKKQGSSVDGINLCEHFPCLWLLCFEIKHYVKERGLTNWE